MEYLRVLKLPQYFRNLQRLSEIVGVLAKHGLGDLINRLQLLPYVRSGVKLIHPSLLIESTSPRDIASRLRSVCEELGPTFIKFGQIVASRPDLFPENIIREFRKLQDEVVPFPSYEARQIIESELGGSIAEHFSTFEDRPLGSASIAQVHRATLLDGTAVVVKVRRPGLERIVDTDLDILRGLAALVEEHIPHGMPIAPGELVEEFARGLRVECDLRREALNLRRFSHALKEHPNLKIPIVFPKFSGTQLLVEEFIDGIPPNRQALEKAGVDPLLVVRTLTALVARSIFETRFFHADPHSGNILITRSGTVALIDFGSMGRIQDDRLTQITRLLIALTQRNVDDLLEVLYESDMARPPSDEIALKTQIGEAMDLYLDADLGSLDLTTLIADVFEIVRRFKMRPPQDLLLVGKALATLETIGAELDPSFVPLAYLEPYLKDRYVSELASPRVLAKRAEHIGMSYLKLLADLPKELRTVTRNLARESFTVHSSVRNLPEIQKHQNAMLNRALITVSGLVFLSLGTIAFLSAERSEHVGLGYGLIALGVVTLVFAWATLRRSGGPR